QEKQKPHKEEIFVVSLSLPTTRAMRERIKGKTLVARDEGDDASGVIIKLYGEETHGGVSILQQPVQPGLPLPPHVHENDVWLYILEGEMHARVGDEVVKATPGS